MVVHTLEQRFESGNAIILRKMNILAKKIVFPDEANFDLGGYVHT